VAGFIKTEGTPLTDKDDQRNFGHAKCDVAACTARAAQISGKVVHVELTPDEHFYGQDARFLPIDSSGPCSDTGKGSCISVLNTRSEDVCVHGVYLIDHGGHSAEDHRRLCCVKDPGHDHPEIHPFDAIWWRNERKNGWIFGVFQDDSNRYSSPYCGGNNGASWSQAPRDVTFRFPFRFPRSAGCQLVQLRHVRTTSMRNGSANVVRPVNVTTSDLVGDTAEVLLLAATGPMFQPLLQVQKEPDSGRETHVRVEGSTSGPDVVGDIVLRAAVGTARRTAPLFDALKRENPLVTYDDSDPGAGYYYSEIFFGGSCGPVVQP
jgi:hypothetical protein